ncbi:CDP-glycerol glycerophosphotransferase family protein [Shewanella youngdeokensis]|uniref:CDP-glycerol glycerophosphotransferase family protein n=1 Tax=Shewanella youngdeokensis TaxID=2999068 RepID=A0ABZ0K1B2_9GAMM|nr:CDP-glycerol glycerophosphotransferase family protein [Shewanella sp. DAU334]
MQYTLLQWTKAICRKLIYQLSKLTPRSKKKAVFGSYKERFSDNSKYLFKHWSNTAFVRCIWVSGDLRIVNQLNENGQEAYLRWSLKGIYHALTAKYYFYNSYIGDINQWLAGGATKVNLWHGTPMKKIEFDITHGPMAAVFNPQSLSQKIIQSLHAHQQRITPDLMLSPSPLVDNLLTSAFKLNGSQLLHCGNPRTDYYRQQAQPATKNVFPIKQQAPKTPLKSLKQQLHNGQYQQVILYAPSWRDSIQGNPYQVAFDWTALSKQLQQHNQLFLLRLHPNEAVLAEQFSDLPNIMNISTLEDVYGLLDNIDLLITDYSSLFIDVMPLNIPVIFYCFDKAHYQQHCRDMYEYVNSLPEIGPQTSTFTELSSSLIPSNIEAQIRQYHHNKVVTASLEEHGSEAELNSYQKVKQLYWQPTRKDAFSALEAWMG